MVSTDQEPPPMVAALRQSLRDLITESQTLRRDVKKDQEQRRRATLVALILAVLFVLIIGIDLAVAYQNNELGRSNQRISERTNEIADRLRDCTVPGGKCHQEGGRRTGAAIEQLDKRNQRSDIAIIQCARALPVDEYPPGPRFDVPFEKCVAAKLAAPPK